MNGTTTTLGGGAPPAELSRADELAVEISSMGPVEAAETLLAHADELVLDTLLRLNPAFVGDILPELPDERRERVIAHGPSAVTRQWALNQTYDEESVGRLMEPPIAVFRPHHTVGQATERLRDMVKLVLITYCYVTEDDGRLVGVVTMRDLLFSDDDTRLEDVMLREIFALRPTTPLMDAMREVVHRHFPVYPVCDDDGRLIGLVRGRVLFEEQAFEISAQAGRMVGVDKEERLGTPWPRSLLFRHPWLQLNLLTAFAAAAVVGVFQQTLDEMVILALFLPVLAGQSGNTGCQALAVTLRGMTLGELRSGSGRRLVSKEALLGGINGVLVGLTAGIGMFVVASAQGNPAAWGLAGIVALAMTGSCVVSGIAGALIPLTLERVGADPATASSIFLTTATDVASMGLFLGLATLLLL
jgi:magnesium transporter